jgi:hypothetical protein
MLILMLVLVLVLVLVIESTNKTSTSTITNGAESPNENLRAAIFYLPSSILASLHTLGW